MIRAEDLSKEDILALFARANFAEAMLSDLAYFAYMSDCGREHCDDFSCVQARGFTDKYGKDWYQEIIMAIRKKEQNDSAI